MPEPKNGERVRLWPTHARVQDGETAYARFMALEGREVIWSRYWWQRMRDGDVTATNPNPAPAPPPALPPSDKDAA
jgi:hypothetical protein